MPLQGSTLCTILPAIGLALSMAYPNAAVGQNAQTLTTYDVVNPPPCTNNKGETVRFIESSRGRSGIAAGMAIRDRSGKPVIFRSNYAATPPELAPDGAFSLPWPGVPSAPMKGGRYSYLET